MAQRYTLFFIILTVLFGCSSTEEKQSPGASSFIATLGSDTLVVEKFLISENQVDAEVVIRSPRTMYLKQSLKFDQQGNFLEFTSSSIDPGDQGLAPSLVQQAVVDGDSIVVTYFRDGESIDRKFGYDPTVLPWIDMVHWPYEVATRRMASAQGTSLDQLMMSGRSPAVFEIRQIEADSVSIKHPYRGTMTASISSTGEILNYDATSTTRKLLVKRTSALDMAKIASRYADRPIGSLSGAAETTITVHGANINITHGQPSRRGRDLFGGIVAWNELWRTGANRASHFTTDKDLQVGDLFVPAGEYTLFSIPAPDGGILIINKETGQNGNRYDESQDLGRVAMSISEVEESLELFTIDAIERDDLGIIRLRWGNTVFEVPFEVID